eukprot:9116052-Pyramimonas_sp.AAC.1
MSTEGHRPKEELHKARSFLAIEGRQPNKASMLPLRLDPGGRVLETAEAAADDLQQHVGLVEFAVP